MLGAGWGFGGMGWMGGWMIDGVRSGMLLLLCND